MKITFQLLTAATLILSTQAFAKTPPPGVYMTMDSQLVGILANGSYCMVVQNEVKNGRWQKTPNSLKLDDNKTVISDDGSGGYALNGEPVMLTNGGNTAGMCATLKEHADRKRRTQP
ncbi:hypothetical protein [Neisseria sicca]|uniref:hypothetical protein n=1 Tax=Neisseria sicca TaxID=490 RepID=UPI000667B979|nr:hypothetical protein [Neisseria sicca]